MKIETVHSVELAVNYNRQALGVTIPPPGFGAGAGK